MPMSATETGTSKRVRIESIDVVRGAVMVLMALDHVRDFFCIPGVNPTDLTQTTIPYFFMRWITHFCAPVFFLLTGTGAYLSLRKKSKRELSRFLFTRGLWLIFLELVVVRCFGWAFNFNYHFTMVQVLWTLGWAMIVLSALVYLPASVVTTFGVVMIASHNLLDNVQSRSWFWSILHVPNVLVRTPRIVVVDVYPLIPWIGVTAVGYVLGQTYRWPTDRRKAFLSRTGLAVTAGFILLRAINRYGDPVRWSWQKSVGFTVLSFLNTTKYPPSLLYLLMTLGPALLFLWVIDGRTPRWLRPVLIVGKVPMFYYLVHIPLIHLLAVAVSYARYGQVRWVLEAPFFFHQPPGWGYSVPIIYLVWVCVVLALYPLCTWFADLKQRRSDAWLSYF